MRTVQVFFKVKGSLARTETLRGRERHGMVPIVIQLSWASCVVFNFDNFVRLKFQVTLNWSKACAVHLCLLVEWGEWLPYLEGVPLYCLLTRPRPYRISMDILWQAPVRKFQKANRKTVECPICQKCVHGLICLTIIPIALSWPSDLAPVKRIAYGGHILVQTATANYFVLSTHFDPLRQPLKFYTGSLSVRTKLHI